MSYIGATGLTDDGERFDELQENIDANASYINNLVGIPDPLHTAIFGINVLNPGLFGLVERAEVKIKLLETAEEGLGTDITGLTTQVEGIQTEVSGIQTEVSGIQGQVLGIEGDISTLNGAVFLEGGAIALVEVQAADALTKANRALDIWDYSGDNVYHKKSGNVGIGTTFGSVLTNKLEVGGNINIPTGSTFRINNEPFNYSHLAGEQPVSSKWTNATDVATNIYYNTGNVGIGITTAINNKLEVNGNINIPTGSKYKINNVNLAFSDLGGTLSYNSLSDKPTLFDGNYNNLTNKLSGGTNIQILNGVINNTYELPKATTAVIGGVRPDGTTITINTSTGVISAAAGTPQVNSDWTQTNTSLKSFIQNKPTAGTNISFANNTITNIITGSPTQNIIDLNNNYLIVKDKPDSQIVTQVDVPLTSANEPVVNPSVVPTTEGNPITHKTLNFAYVAPPPLTYDFTNYNTEATWKAYAATIPNFTYSLDSFLTSFDPDAVWYGYEVVGWVQMTLPSGYNFLTITYGLGTWTGGADNIVRLLINGVVKSTATNTNRSITYSQAYNAGDVVRIEETLSTMSANFIFQFTNTNSQTYTLSVQPGTSIQVNNGTAQYLSGNYTISVGATQSSVVVAGIGQVGSDPYPLQNGSTIAIRYSMLQRITSTINIKKDGLIKYVPASTTNPTTGSWQIADIDSISLSQFGGNISMSKITPTEELQIVGAGTATLKIRSTNDDGTGNPRIEFLRGSDTFGSDLSDWRIESMYGTGELQFYRESYYSSGKIVFTGTGTIGVGVSGFSVQGLLHLKAENPVDVSLKLDVNNTASLVIQAFTIGTTDVGWKFIASSGITASVPISFSHNGNIYFQQNRWHYCSNGNERLGFNANDTTFIRGHGATPISFRNSTDVELLTINSGGGVIGNNYILARGGGNDTWIYSESGSMSLNMGLQNTQSAPSYMRLGAYAGHTYIESNQNRSIRLVCNSGIFTGTLRQWEFNINGNSYNPLNSTTWTQTSDQRIKENIVKADLKTCYDNVKNINLYRFKYIDAFDNEYRDKNKLGYIAQEVKRHFPKATTREKRRLNDKREIPDLLTIDVEQINLSLYGAVKQLIKIVEKQNKRIKTLETLLNIDDNDDVENDAGEAYERIHDEEEIDIDTIEPTEPEQDKAPEPSVPTESPSIVTESD